MTQSYRLQHLFKKYLRNDCTQAELEELVTMLNDMDDDELDGPMKALWQKAKENSDENNVDWDKMYTEVTGSEESLVTIRQTRRSNFRRLWINVAAAAVVLVILAIGMGYYLRKHATPPRTAFAEKLVPVKKTDSIILDDGSKIVLNAGSSLRYPDSFHGRTREVYLEGEAIFDVTHDPARPFIIHSGQLKTVVLGTKFDVSAYPGAEKMQVTVISGKVSVEEIGSKKIATLLPNQRVVFNTKTNAFVANNLASVAPQTAWQEGRIGFDDASLAEVAAQFYRRYGVHVTLENPNLANCHISIVLNNDLIDNLLKTITSLTNSNYRYKGNEVVIYGEGCN
ncbi:MAG: FecR domain-containing protein [Bacteroidetes bacterium]|nr:FecR domain-containing protein [Bacteroidota bacterium]